jgi:hypothetical protein
LGYPHAYVSIQESSMMTSEIRGIEAPIFHPTSAPRHVDLFALLAHGIKPQSLEIQGNMDEHSLSIDDNEDDLSCLDMVIFHSYYMLLHVK